MEGLVGTVSDTRTSVARADGTLAGLQDDVPHLLEAIGQSKELLAKARSTVNEYGTALSKNATDGALQLSSAAAQAQRALGTVSGDVAAAEAATNTALATAEGLLADNKVLINDLTAQAGAAGADPAIDQALSEARAANKRLTTTTDALRTASDDLASTADSLETEASALDTAAQSASETIRTTSGHLPRQRAAGHHDQLGFPGGSLRQPGRSSARTYSRRSPRHGPFWGSSATR